MDPLQLIKIKALMSLSSGNPGVVVGIIDGPVDINHPDLKNSAIRTLTENSAMECRLADSAACMHGTLITGIIAAKRDSIAPGIVPKCKIVLRPIFSEGNSKNENIPKSTQNELAAAIFETIEAKAKIINLSVGLTVSSSTLSSILKNAYDYAQQKGVIIVTASGNNGNIGNITLVNHPWIIPVVACDERSKPSNLSNLSVSIGKRGLMAPGVDIISTAPGGKYARVSGTSVAAPFVTGSLALLLSAMPDLSPMELRNTILMSTEIHRRSIIPPLMNVELTLKKLKAIHYNFNNNRRVITVSNENKFEKMASPNVNKVSTTIVGQENSQIIDSQQQIQAAVVTEDQSVLPVNAEKETGCTKCGGNHSTESESPNFIYALGSIDVIIPNENVEKEIAQRISERNTANLTDKEVMYQTLKENRDLAIEVCWSFSVEGIDAYLLIPKDPLAFDQLVEAIKPMDGKSPQIDRDVIIGVKGPIAPMDMCNGLMLPTVIFDRIYSFDIPALLNSLPIPKGVSEKAFRKTSEELFNQIIQMADNVGSTDEHRAINYLVLRYPAIYSKTTEMYAQDYSLTGIYARSSNFNEQRNIFDVIFTYVNRKTQFKEQFFCSVNVGKWPFLERPLNRFLEI